MNQRLNLRIFFLIFITTSLSNIYAQFKEVPSGVENVNNSSVAWGDYDNDDDLDLLIMGWNGKERLTKIFQNNQGKFQAIETKFEGVNSIVSNNLAWGDYDNDGNLDIIVTGQNGEGRIARIYHNNEDGDFNEHNHQIDGVFASTVAWGDYDNDGDLDILMTGRNPDHAELTRIYKNEGGDFELLKANLYGVEDGVAAWGDYDNDGDWDILLTGRYDARQLHSISKIYRNDEGKFIDINAGLEPVSRSSVAWGDYDNDNDLDILLTGYTDDKKAVTHIYRNNKGVFTKIPLNNIVGVIRSSVAWGDYDNDNDLDFVISGVDQNNKRITKLYQNQGNEQFNEVSYKFADIASGAVAWGDYDNDGDLDLIVSGEDANFKIYTKLYENTLNARPQIGAIPQNLKAEVKGNQVILSWDKSREGGLSYNLRIGTRKDGEDVFISMSNPATGFRKVVEEGNTAHHTTWTVNNLKPGTYYWSVQAVNNAYKASAFAPEQTFVVK